MLILASQFSRRPLLIWEDDVMAAVEGGSITRIATMALTSIERFKQMRKLIEITIDEVDPALIEDYLKQTERYRRTRKPA